MAIGDAILYCQAWKSGSVWVIPPNPIDMTYAVNGALIWLTGEDYDHQDGTAPSWWKIIDMDAGSIGP